MRFSNTILLNLPKKYNKSPQKRKFRLLLDSAFAKPSLFPRLLTKSNLAHCVHTFQLSKEAEDEEIYEKAVKENRFVLTINFKDFKKLVKIGKPGILGIESQLSNEEIDEKVSSFLSGKDPKDYMGKAIKI